MALLPVDEALALILGAASPVGPEDVPLSEAGGRVLAGPVEAMRDQPPFDASAMDGYAVRAADVAGVPARLRVVGESAAGRRFAGRLEPGEAVRIFTGAPLPDGADTILIQENTRREGDAVVALEPVEPNRHIRRAGLDFRRGDLLLEAGRVLDPAALSLAAAANRRTLSVVGRPLVGMLATGDELVAPGEEPGPDQIVSSNNVGVAEIVRLEGGMAIELGIAPDRRAVIRGALDRALAAGADVIVTIGGASVGDHDLVREVLIEAGAELAFWKIAMRPGKPLMFGRLGTAHVMGLPGNPVSAMVCSHLFLAPLVARLAGRPHRPDLRPARLGAALPANGDRQDYVRAATSLDGTRLVATPFSTQDSSMLRTLAASDALIVRPPGEPGREAGESCTVLMLR